MNYLLSVFERNDIPETSTSSTAGCKNWSEILTHYCLNRTREFNRVQITPSTRTANRVTSPTLSPQRKLSLSCIWLMLVSQSRSSSSL